MDDKPYRQVYVAPEAPFLKFSLNGQRKQFQNGMFITNSPEETADMDAEMATWSGTSLQFVTKLDEQGDANVIAGMQSAMQQPDAIQGSANSQSLGGGLAPEFLADQQRIQQEQAQQIEPGSAEALTGMISGLVQTEGE